jgi:phosphoribosylpyrophosphate synthetase
LKLLNFSDYVREGVRQEGDELIFDFTGDKEGDIMSLSFSSGRSRIQKKGNTEYQYYYAYELPYKQQGARDLVYKLKMMDDTLNKDSIQLLVNKAVMGVDNTHNLASFDSIIYPKSSSKILTAFAEQLQKKSGVAKLIPDSFVKASREQIKFDWNKIDNLEPKTKNAVTKIADTIKGSEGEFKMKEIFAPYRKFISDFLIFNSEETKEVYNLVSGKRVILVDDYRTSGTSLKQMMDILVRYEPEYILAVILVKIS